MFEFFKKKAKIKANDPRVTELASQMTGNAISKIKAQLGYGGGRFAATGDRSGGAKYPFGLSASGSGRYLDHKTLRLNARDAYHDSPQAKAIIERFSDTVVDTGLVLEASPKHNLLGITPEAAETWSKDVEERFDAWCGAKIQHRSEGMTFYQAQRLYQLSQQRDGDVFMRLIYSPDTGLLNPLQFEFVDPDQIRGDAYTSTYGPSTQADGIERDSRGREKIFKIWINDFQTPGKYKFVDVPKKGVKSGRIFMLHGFAPEYAGQGRGYSRIAHALQEFENITDFSLASIKKAINQSNVTMWVKPSQDNAASNPFEDILTNAGAGPAADQFGSNPVPSDCADGVTAESIQPVTYCPMPEATIDTPGSTAVFNLNEGEELKAFDSKSPGDSFNTFVDAFTAYLAASVGMPIEVLLMRFNSNYSASRASLIMFWRIANIWRQEMASDLLNPVYEMWLSEEIGAGRITAAGWSDPIMKSAWLSNNWIGAPMPNIDPAKTMNADKGYVEMGATTLDRVARNLNGSSGASNRAKLAREFSELPESPWKKPNGGK
jgi:lambda family phage portal protein